ncbi:hypothetical protein GOP47_0003368, partial [Adiantum capillus-veneris]
MAGSQDTALYNIKKLDGTNFPLWKKQIWHVLVQKKQIKPINLKGIKPEDMDEDEWSEMDELALSTIMLTLAESVYFNVADEMSAYQAWLKLSNLYEKKSAASQVYWLKKHVDLKIKEGTPMSDHLNEFNTIYSQLSAQGVKFDEPVRAMFLLITLPESWDTFRTNLSNSTPPDGLNIAGVEGSLLTEETNRKTMDKGKGTPLVVKGRTKEKYKGGKRNQSRSKSRNAKGKSDIECYHCGKKGHMKRDCREWKAEKGKEKSEDHGEKNKSSVSKGSMTVAHGVKSGGIYMIYVSNVSKNVINVTEQPNASLWHSRLGHMSKKGMEILSR